MSAVAGRVLLIPKGSYNSGITYNMLDVVTYEYDSYVAKTTTIGHDPTDTTYWQKMTDVGDDVNSLKETFTKNGAHNLLPMTLANIKAININGTWSNNVYNRGGVNFTVNTDSNGNVTDISLNGTAETNIEFHIINSYTNGKGVGLPQGSYILSGGKTNNKRIYFYNGSQWYNDTTGNGIEFSISGSETRTQVTIVIVSGQTCSNEKFYPMVRSASDPDSTFEPYAMTNRELTQELTKEVLYFTNVACAATTGDFVSLSDERITANHVVAECSFSRPPYIVGDVNWTTTNGNLKFNGTCTNAVNTANITLVKKGN